MAKTTDDDRLKRIKEQQAKLAARESYLNLKKKFHEEKAKLFGKKK